jgi:hypothetical protein
VKEDEELFENKGGNTEQNREGRKKKKRENREKGGTN